MAGGGHFGPELFRFLEELKRNNEREWFAANKERYEADVREPLQTFIIEFAPRLREISPHYVADPSPVGGSMFRIHRDVRFSRDKSPYKTHAAAQFRHEDGKDVHAPGIYLHLEPGDVFCAFGLWQPDPRSLAKIRDTIAANPRGWKRVISGRTFAENFSLTGDSLKRPPRGYDPDHPLMEDLKRKDFIAYAPFDRKTVCAPDFLDRFVGKCCQAAPFMRFLTGCLGLPW